MNIWKIRGKLLKFPSHWTKKEVMSLVNHEYIHICEICGKIDIMSDHYTKNH